MQFGLERATKLARKLFGVRRLPPRSVLRLGETLVFHRPHYVLPYEKLAAKKTSSWKSVAGVEDGSS